MIEAMLFDRSITFEEQDRIASAAAENSEHVLNSADERFIEKLKEGDRDAFELLIDHYSNDIYAMLVRLNGNAEEAADLTQETFLSVFNSIDGFRGDSSIRTWLFRIAINHSRNRHRWWKRRRRDSTVSIDDTLGNSTLSIHETLSDKRSSPEENTLRRERERSLLAALGELPAKFREAVVLCDIEGLSYEEIARLSGVNIGTVKSRIARGREQLRRRLRDL